MLICVICCELKKTDHQLKTKRRWTTLSGLVHRISGRSVREIDYLVQGLQGLREKLHFDGARLENEISKYSEFSDIVIQLTKIASDSMAHVNRRSVEGEKPNSLLVSLGQVDRPFEAGDPLHPLGQVPL